MGFAGLYAGAAADTQIAVICRLCQTDDSKIIEVSLGAVIRTAGNRSLDMIMTREYLLFDLFCHILCIDIRLDTVDTADTGHDIAGTDGRKAGIGFHFHTALGDFNILQIVLQLFIDGIDILIFDAGDGKTLAGTKMKGAVSVCFCQMLDEAQILCLYQTAGNTHLQHVFTLDLGLTEAVGTKGVDIHIL